MDQTLIANGGKIPWQVSGLGYAIQGTRNGSPVVFNTIVKNGQITHRDAIPLSQWEQRTRSFGWPGNLDDVPTGTANWPGQ